MPSLLRNKFVFSHTISNINSASTTSLHKSCIQLININYPRCTLSFPLREPSPYQRHALAFFYPGKWYSCISVKSAPQEFSSSRVTNHVVSFSFPLYARGSGRSYLQRDPSLLWGVYAQDALSSEWKTGRNL